MGCRHFRAASPTGLSVLLWAAVLAGLAGCEDRADKVSEYPYFLNVINKRWEIARTSLKSDKPDINYVVVLLRDIQGVCESMDWSYQGANRDEAIARIRDITKKFSDDLHTKVDMRFEQAKLLPGVTVQDVAESVEKAYQEYQQFKPMVSME